MKVLIIAAHDLALDAHLARAAAAIQEIEKLSYALSQLMMEISSNPPLSELELIPHLCIDEPLQETNKGSGDARPTGDPRGHHPPPGAQLRRLIRGPPPSTANSSLLTQYSKS